MTAEGSFFEQSGQETGGWHGISRDAGMFLGPETIHRNESDYSPKVADSRATPDELRVRRAHASLTLSGAVDVTTTLDDDPHASSEPKPPTQLKTPTTYELPAISGLIHGLRSL